MAKEANRSASARPLIIGAMTPAAPASMTRLAVAKSSTGVRTIAGRPASATATIDREAPAKSSAPCCMSRITASNPSRASASATAASFMPTQAVNVGASADRVFDSLPITASVMRAPVSDKGPRTGSLRRVHLNFIPARRSLSLQMVRSSSPSFGPPEPHPWLRPRKTRPLPSAASFFFAAQEGFAGAKTIGRHQLSMLQVSSRARAPGPRPGGKRLEKRS